MGNHRLKRRPRCNCNKLLKVYCYNLSLCVFFAVVVPLKMKVQRKLAVVGYPAVGKSSMTTCFVEDRFVENYDPTIENTFHKTIKINNVSFVTDIVDTAGMDEYSSFSRAASVGVHGYVLVYAISSRASFEKLEPIYEKLVNMLGIEPPRVLVGSMSDLDFARRVSVEEGQALALKWKCPFIECSAKHNANVGTYY